MRSLFSRHSRHPTTTPPPSTGGETPPRRRFPKENVDPSSPAHHPHAADHSPSPFRSPNSAAKPLGTRNRSLPPRPPPSNPLKRKLDVSAAAAAGPAPDGAGVASAPESGVQVVVRIRPPCRVEEEYAGENGRGPEPCVRKTATNSVAIQGQDFTFDAVADAGSTQVRLGHWVKFGGFGA